MSDTVIDRIGECLNDALRVRDEHTQGVEKNQDHGRAQRLAWLGRQMQTLIAALQGMLADLESGLSVRDLGYGEDELLDELETIETQIRQVRRSIQEIGHGI